jgi:hypothetical protein
VWFAAKRPSNGTAASQEEVAASWQSSGSGAWGVGSGAAGYDSGEQGDGPPGSEEPAERTSSGLPRRVPRTNGFPGSTPDFGVPAAPTAPTASAGVLGTPAEEGTAQDNSYPAAGTPYRGSTYQGSLHQEAPQQETPQQETGRQEMGRQEMGRQEMGRQEAPRGEQLPQRRRSAEAARSRLSGFQLGSRDAEQAGPGPRPPHAGEENGR